MNWCDAQVPLEITFHPKQLNQDVCYEGLQCRLDAGKTLSLSLTGACIEPTLHKEVGTVLLKLRSVISLCAYTFMLVLLQYKTSTQII